MSLPIEGSKSTKRTHLNKVWEQTGVKPKELADQPELPKELDYIWGWFIEILGGGTFSWAELQSWASIRGVRLQAGEIELLLSLNNLYASAHNGR